MDEFEFSLGRQYNSFIQMVTNHGQPKFYNYFKIRDSGLFYFYPFTDRIGLRNIDEITSWIN